MKVKTLLVTESGYLLLQSESRRQRGGEITEAYESHLRNSFAKYADCKLSDGQRAAELINGSLGGGKGKDCRTWTSWTLDQMAEMLKAANLPFEYGQGEYSSFAI